MLDISDNASPMWERACPRRGRHIQHQCRLTHRLREQARSHRGCGVPAIPGHQIATIADSILAG